MLAVRQWNRWGRWTTACAVLAVVALGGLSGCDELEPNGIGESSAELEADLAQEWAALAIELTERTPGFTPPVAARAFGYFGLTMYEALLPSMPDNVSMVGQLNGTLELAPPEPGDHHWPTVANAALATCLRNSYQRATPEDHARIDALEAKFAAQRPTWLDDEVVERSIRRGHQVASAVHAYSLDDGGVDADLRNFPAYEPPNGDGMWVPTLRPDGGPPLGALQPQWGSNRPFVLPADGDPTVTCSPGAPPPYSTEPGSAFYQEAMEVYDAVMNGTDEHVTIARYWADDPGVTPTPPGHSVSILHQVLDQENATLEQAAEAYLLVGLAVSDAFVACWHTKYTTNVMRPVSYLQAIHDPSWTSLVETPPFPEYTSGHSVQSGAAFEVMTHLFGEDYAFTDRTHVSRGFAPRHFESFEAAGYEASWSRLYGGIHYRSAIVNGKAQGRCIGAAVTALELER